MNVLFFLFSFLLNFLPQAISPTIGIPNVVQIPGVIHSDEFLIPAAIRWAPEQYQQLGQLRCYPNEIDVPRFVIIVATKLEDDFNLRKEEARKIVMQVDSAINFSARINGNGIRHLRFECDNDNRPKVIWESDYDMTIDLMNALVRKYSSADRKIIAFHENFGGCGYAWLVPNSQKENNPNETYSGGSFISYYCMGVDVVAHEIIHQLGAVQNDAPHFTSGYHCTDMYDIMCYYTGEWLCDNVNYALILFDCNGDDYFRVNDIPIDNYLYDHWNIADSRFLDKSEDMYLPIVFSNNNATCELCVIN